MTIKLPPLFGVWAGIQAGATGASNPQLDGKTASTMDHGLLGDAEYYLRGTWAANALFDKGNEQSPELQALRGGTLSMNADTH
jgi:hypothetical protein